MELSKWIFRAFARARAHACVCVCGVHNRPDNHFALFPLICLNYKAHAKLANVRALGRFPEIVRSDFVIYEYVCLSAWNSSAPTGRIFMKFDIWVFTENFSKNKVCWNLVRIKGAFHDDLCTFMIPRQILITMWNISVKSCGENQNSILCSANIFQNLCRLGSQP
jgi:hypothetical protein